MNHVYKTIWNEQTGTFVAVSEHKRARSKRSGSVKAALAGAVLATGALAMGSAWAATGIDGGAGAGTAISRCTGGAKATAGKNNSIAIGCNAVADNVNDENVFFWNRQNPYNNNIDTTGTYQSVAVGTGAKARKGSIALGHGAQAAQDESEVAIAIGAQAKAQNNGSLAIGPAALATGNAALALGRQTAAKAAFAQAIGNVAAATGVGSLAVGHSATATGKRSIAIGAADLDKAGSAGTQNSAAYTQGEQTLATGTDAIAFGAAAKAESNYALAIGAHSQGLGARSIAMGPNAKATGVNALALGSLSEAQKTNSIAVGVGAKAKFANSVALGSNSSVDHINSVAIGTGSTTNDYTTHVAFLYKSGDAGAIATGAVSVGNGVGSVVNGAGNERRLQNVAAGGADTDAVNVSQLKMLKAITDKTGGDLAENLGGGSTYNPNTGEVSNPTYNIGDTNYNNVGDALLAARTVVKAGKNIGVEESKGTAGQTIFTVKTQENLDLTSVTTGHAVMNNDGFKVADGSNSTTVGAGNISVKDDAGTTVIAGDQMTVGSQNSVVINGGTGTIGGLTNKTFDLNNFTSGQAATEDQLVQVSGALTDTGLRFSANAGGPLTSKLGSTVTVAGAQTNTDWSKFDAGQNIMTQIGQDASGNSAIRVALSKDITGLETIILGENGTPGKDGVDGKPGVGINGKDGSIGMTGKDGAGADLTVAMGAPGLAGNDGVDGKSKTRLVYEKSDGSIEEVATLNDGLRFVGDDGKVVERKLNETLGLFGGADVNALSDDNIGVVQKDDGSLGIKLAKNLKDLDSITINNGPVINGDGINMGGKRITNLAAGEDDTDAVNMSQLKSVSDVANAGWNVTDTGGNSVNIGPNGQVTFVGDKNITVEQTGTDDDGQLEVKLNKDIDLGADGSLKTGDTVINNAGVAVGNDVHLGNTGLTINNGPSITLAGINAGGMRITNVAAGLNPTDAVNYGQLQPMESFIGLDGNGSFAYNGGQHSSLKDVLDSMHWNVEAPTPGKEDGNTGGSNGPGPGSGSGSGSSSSSGGGNNGSGDGTPIHNGNTVGFVEGDNIVISKADRVNDAGQTVGADIKVSVSQDLKVTSITAVNVQADEIQISNGGPIINENGINMSGKHITNVAAGVNDTDAVNVSQLNQVAGNLQGQINNIRHDINRLDNRLSAGVAAAMATASLPQAYLPGKHMMSMAGGTWRGESGMAIGFSGITDNGKWVYKLSGNTTSRGDYGGAVGIGYQW